MIRSAQIAVTIAVLVFSVILLIGYAVAGALLGFSTTPKQKP